MKNNEDPSLKGGDCLNQNLEGVSNSLQYTELKDPGLKAGVSPNLINNENPSLKGRDVKTPMQASKWLQTQVLLDVEEMEMLLAALGEIEIFIPGRVLKKGEEKISSNQFLQTYREYIKTLQQGKIPEDNVYRGYFSSIWTLSREVVFSVNVDSERHLLRLAEPAIQLQLHRLGYSEIERKFRPMVFGKDSIDWGIQFSYPQLFQNPHTHLAEKVDISTLFPNTLLFQQLQRWLRIYSQPTPFVVKEEKIHAPIRIGKKCFSWINHHPQLIEKNIKIGF